MRSSKKSANSAEFSVEHNTGRAAASRVSAAPAQSPLAARPARTPSHLNTNLFPCIFYNKKKPEVIVTVYILDLHLNKVLL